MTKSLTSVIARYTLYSMAKDLIDQLNIYRLERKLTQPQLAKKLGVTFQTVNRWLNRHMKPGQIHEYHIRKMIMRDSKTAGMT